MTHTTRNCLLSLKLLRFGNIIWKVQSIPLTLLWIIRTLNIFLLLRSWLRGKHSGPSISSSSILSLGSALVVSAPNWMLSLDNGTFILKGRILAIPQSTLTTSNLSLLKNNLQLPYKLLFSSFLLSVQLQLCIWIPYIKTFSWLSLAIQLLQNTSLQMASDLQTQTIYSFSTTEFMYHLLVTSVHIFSSIIMIIFSLDILVKTKHWNWSAADTSSLASMLIYNNSASPVFLVCDLSHNVISSTNLSNNSLFLNNYGIPFL